MSFLFRLKQFGWICACVFLILCIASVVSACKGNTSGSSASAELSTTDSVSPNVEQQVQDIHQRIPLTVDEGTIPQVTYANHEIVIEYVMPEERFMSYYERPVEQRVTERQSFMDMLQTEELQELIASCKTQNILVILKVVGVTSGESFTIELTD